MGEICDDFPVEIGVELNYEKPWQSQRIQDTAFQEGNRITKNSDVWGRKRSINIEWKSARLRYLRPFHLSLDVTAKGYWLFPSCNLTSYKSTSFLQGVILLKPKYDHVTSLVETLQRLLSVSGQGSIWSAFYSRPLKLLPLPAPPLPPAHGLSCCTARGIANFRLSLASVGHCLFCSSPQEAPL